MEFISPRFLSEAFEVLDQRTDRVLLAGGFTHLLRHYPQFPEGLPSSIDTVLHVGDLQALADSRDLDGDYDMGSMTTLGQIERDAFLNRYAPALADAARSCSTPQIRNRRTLAGELAWGSLHSPVIAVLMSLEAKVRVRRAGEKSLQGREEHFDLLKFYEEIDPALPAAVVRPRVPVLRASDFILGVKLSHEVLHQPGAFGFVRSLEPKISTENPGLVIAVRGNVRHGILESTSMVCAGLWMSPAVIRLPLEGAKLNDLMIFEKLYHFCDRYQFDKMRRDGPQGKQLSLMIFGLLKDGFSGFLGRP